MLLSLTMGLIPSANANHAIPTEFRFFGSGYGHGVGMSQIGARGQALEGKSALEILNYYYPGTEVAAYPDNALIRVNLMNQIQSATLKPINEKSGFYLYQGDVPVGENPEPFGRYDGTFTATFTNFAGFVTPLLSSPTAKLAPFAPAQSWTIRWDSDTVISLGNESETALYKYGQITFKSTSTLLSTYLSVTNTLRLHDEYLWGLGEVPSSWPSAALEAQAIAARTYALGKLQRMRPECDCNIYDTTIDQNFVGFAKENEAIYGVKWKEAVSRTFVDSESALTVILRGKPISAFYFSSSGGKTQNVKEVWGSEIAYLQGVPDPWSLDPTINRRFALWSRFVPQATISQAFLLPNVVDFSIDSRTATGSVAQITAYSSTGQKSTLTGEVFRARVKLPSTWIRNERAIPKYQFRISECVQSSKRPSEVCFS